MNTPTSIAGGAAHPRAEPWMCRGGYGDGYGYGYGDGDGDGYGDGYGYGDGDVIVLSDLAAA